MIFRTKDVQPFFEMIQDLEKMSENMEQSYQDLYFQFDECDTEHHSYLEAQKQLRKALVATSFLLSDLLGRKE